MKVIFRFFLYIGSFYLLMFISSFILIPFAIIYDLVNWLISQSSWRSSKRKRPQKIHVTYSEIDAQYSAKCLQELGYKSKK